jgi:hypothetical protein
VPDFASWFAMGFALARTRVRRLSLAAGPGPRAAVRDSDAQADATWLITVPPISDGDRKLAAMLRFRGGLRLLRQQTDEMPTDHLPVNHAMLARYLRALDADLAGPPLRPVADILFGPSGSQTICKRPIRSCSSQPPTRFGAAAP